MEKDKVIIFPKWKKTLEEESLQALKEKRYQDALGKLNKLIGHDIQTHEILTGKIICLMELGKIEQAEDLCLELLHKENEHYFEYAHIYLTLLFQMSKYEEVIQQVDDIFRSKTVPDNVRQQFWQLYEISHSLNQDTRQEEASQYINALEAAIENKDAAAQWRILSKCRNLTVTPHLNLMKRLLIEREIHPAVKTVILQWLQSQEINQPVRVEKLGYQVEVNPSQLETIEEHATTKHIITFLKDIEQENPTLFQLIEKLLHRYLFIRFPVMPPEEDLFFISKALQLMGDQYLHMRDKSEAQGKVQFYIQEISENEQKYFSVIED